MKLPSVKWEKELDLTKSEPRGFRYYLKRAKEKALSSWHYAIFAGFALVEAAWAGIEFVLHVLHIPHWH